jgi:preprotein translocase subunit SecE
MRQTQPNPSAKAEAEITAQQGKFAETIGELKKVHWPTWPEARRLTVIVIIVLIFMALFLGLVDWVGNQILILAIGV